MTATRPSGCSVFLVEDEVMIRMMVADMLEELGYRVAAEAGEIGEALKLAESTDFDFAILDVNVNGKVITPVAELIKAKNRPFIFATGYGSSIPVTCEIESRTCSAESRRSAAQAAKAASSDTEEEHEKLPAEAFFLHRRSHAYAYRGARRGAGAAGLPGAEGARTP